MTNRRRSHLASLLDRAGDLRKFTSSRYWAPRGGTYVEDDGYLVDPQRGEFSHNSSLGTLSDGDLPSCLVLLGEPGIGKSTELKQALAAGAGPDAGNASAFIDCRLLGTVEALHRKLREGPVGSWRAGTYHLTLFLDSLDEGLLTVRVLAGVLAEEISQLDQRRLSLRIACRTADWPASLGAALQVQWGEPSYKEWELVPLRAVDVAAAACQAGVEDPLAFLDAIREAARSRLDLSLSAYC